MAPQTPVQAGTGHRWIEEFPRDRQQILQGQLQGRPQVHNNAFLGRSQSGLHVMGAMRGVVDSVTLFPLAKGGAGGVIQPGQGAFTKRRRLNLSSNCRGGTRLLMKTNVHVPDSISRASKTARRMPRASNRA